MNKEAIMVIDIPFNVKKHPFWPEFEAFRKYDSSKVKSQTKEWIDYRIDIFMKYTANSLMNQTNQNFICLIRYSKETKNLIFDALSRYEKLPSNIVFTDDGDKYILDNIIDYKYIYHIRLDSDNMYHKDFIEKLHQIEFYEELQCILCQSGYIYELKDKRVASMFHSSPSFYALTYTVDDFIVGFNHYVSDDHWGAVKLVNKKIIDPSFMILAHDKNLDNDFDLLLRYNMSKILDEKTKNEVLKDFNIL